MSQANVELVRQTFEAFRNDGFDGLLPFFPPDVVWYPYPEWIEKAEYHGYEGMREVASVWLDNFDDYALNNEDIRDLGETVVVLCEQTGRIKGSDLPLRQPIGVVCSDFRGDGTVGEMRWFLSHEQALEAAGLRE